MNCLENVLIKLLRTLWYHYVCRFVPPQIMISDCRKKCFEFHPSLFIMFGRHKLKRP